MDGSHPIVGLVRGLARSALVGLLLAVPLAAQRSRGKDSIVLKSGATQSEKVESEDYAGVLLSGAVAPIPWADVVSITYSGEEEYDEAFRRMTDGRVAEALSAFQALKQKGKLRAPIQQHVLFFIPILLQKTGDLEGALAGFQELIQAFPTGRYLRSAAESTLSLYLVQKNYAGAEAALEKIAKTSIGARDFQSEVSLLKGRLLEVQKDFVRAEVSYGLAERGSPAAALEAKLGQARCFAGQGKKSEAEAAFQRLIPEKAPNHILAGAWNGIGDLGTEEGRAKRDSQRLQVAVFAYMRGIVQYAPLPGEPTLEYEHALAGAGRCFQLISELEQNDEKRKVNAENARKHHEMLRTEFPNSIYLEGF